MNNHYEQLYRKHISQNNREPTVQEIEHMFRQLGLMYNSIGVVIKDITKVVASNYVPKNSGKKKVTAQMVDVGSQTISQGEGEERDSGDEKKISWIKPVGDLINPMAEQPHIPLRRVMIKPKYVPRKKRNHKFRFRYPSPQEEEVKNTKQNTSNLVEIQSSQTMQQPIIAELPKQSEQHMIAENPEPVQSTIALVQNPQPEPILAQNPNPEQPSVNQEGTDAKPQTEQVNQSDDVKSVEVIDLDD